MKNSKKKGFTIVELVIVIGVIGILSGILIPTFVNLTQQANAAATKSNLANAYSMYVADAADGKVDDVDALGKIGEAAAVDDKKTYVFTDDNILGQSEVYLVDATGDAYKFNTKDNAWETTPTSGAIVTNEARVERQDAATNKYTVTYGGYKIVKITTAA